MFLIFQIDLLLDRGHVVHKLDKNDVKTPEELIKVMKDTVTGGKVKCRKTGLVSYLSDNSRPLSSFYFALIMTIFFAAAPEVFFAAKFHQAVMTTLQLLYF